MLFLVIGAVATVFFFLIWFFRSHGGSSQLARAERFEQEGRHDEAFLAYEALLRNDPLNVDALYRLARLSQSRGAYPRAINACQALLSAKKFPERVNEADVRYLLGLSFLAIDSLPNAFVEFYKALKLRPAHPGATARIGVLYAGQGKVEEGIKFLKRAAALDPENGEIHYFLGLLCAEKGDQASATAALEKAVRQSPQNIEANYYLGLYYKDQKNLDNAIRRFQHIVRTAEDPQVRAQVNRMLGTCYKEKGLIDEAITHYQSAAGESAGDQEMHKDILYNLGMAYTKRGEGEKALDTWRDLQKADGSYKDVQELLNLGRRGFEMKDFEDAVRSWERITTKESDRIRGAGSLLSRKRFDIDRLVRELGGPLDGGAEPRKEAGKSLIERLFELNNKQYAMAGAAMLKGLGFTIERSVSSTEDSDFEEGKAVAFIAVRRDPRSRSMVRSLVQIRRWRENVGPIPIGNCLDMMHELKLESGIFFVTAQFSEAALNVARRDGRLRLVDRRGMVEALKKVLKSNPKN